MKERGGRENSLCFQETSKVLQFQEWTYNMICWYYQMFYSLLTVHTLRLLLSEGHLLSSTVTISVEKYMGGTSEKHLVLIKCRSPTYQESWPFLSTLWLCLSTRTGWCSLPCYDASLVSIFWSLGHWQGVNRQGLGSCASATYQEINTAGHCSTQHQEANQLAHT